jgi:hypothetical protein
MLAADKKSIVGLGLPFALVSIGTVCIGIYLKFIYTAFNQRLIAAVQFLHFCITTLAQSLQRIPARHWIGPLGWQLIADRVNDPRFPSGTPPRKTGHDRFENSMSGSVPGPVGWQTG